MPAGKKILTKAITAAVFILLEIAAISMLSHSSDIQGIWLSGISHRFMAKAWGGSESVRHYFSLKSENDVLAEENFQLKQLIRAYESLPDSLDKEKMVAGFKAESDFRYLPATIVKMSRNKQHNYIILNKGYEDGIRPQSGIISGKGVIGIIDAVDKNYSYALSFMNSGISVSSRIGREGSVGPLSWDGASSNGAILKEIPLQFQFAPGDTVWTSGFSSIFPPDIPLGVIGKSNIVNGAVNECQVTLFEDFSALRYVTIVENIGREEILSLESMENNIEK